MAEAFGSPSPNAPATSAAAVTPHDSNNIANGPARSLFIGGAGNVAAVFPDGSVVTFTGIAAGTVLPIRVSRVNSTNTTATLILALF